MFELPVLEALSLEQAADGFLRPFDLAKAPLFRAALWTDGADHWYLLMDSHHIVGDGLSTPLVMERLDRLYQQKEPEMPQVSYIDWAYQQSKRKPPACRYRQYWSEKLSASPEGLELPTDYPRPPVFDFKGRQVSFALPRPLSEACEQLCRQKGSPLLCCLRRPTASFCPPSAASGICWSARRFPGVCSRSCGGSAAFLNTLPLRLTLTEQMSVSDLFEQLRVETAGLLDHQAMPLEELVSMLELPRSLAQNALYQALFSLRPCGRTALCWTGSRLPICLSRPAAPSWI